MGCTPSKQTVCRNCNAKCSPVRRSYSSNSYHSPLDVAGDHRRSVALTSTTLGNYLHLDPSKPNQILDDPILAQICQEPVRRNVPEKNCTDFSVGVIDAETWSKTIDEKIMKMVPKTPVRTPPGEPETINAWELMEGLDDSSPALRPPSTADDHIRCSSFNSQEKHRDVEELHKPLTLQIANTPPDSNSKSIQNGKTSGKDKLTLYFTSLRGVRKTYEDCCHVRVLLKSSGVRVDERDVSMHSGFKEELKELLGDRFGGVGLPKVFVGKKYIGGADEIRRLHEEFHLDKVLEGCEMVDDGGGCGGGGGGGCEACGDVRFLPCETCSGSCKIYYEVNSDEGDKENEEEEEEEEGDYGFQRCPECNENGLVRCPNCWN